MEAARLAAYRRFEFVQVPMPEPTEDEVLVRMEYVSLCGSDLRFYDRQFPDDAYPLATGIPCHECVGIVEHSNVKGLVPGQRVIALHGAGLAEYVAVPARRVVPVPSVPFDPAMWVLCQPVATVVHAVRELKGVLGKRVVIIGQGPIGLTFTNLISAHGAQQVIAVDLLEYRLDKARHLGATHTINCSNVDLREAVSEITHGAMADITVDAAGRPEAAHNVFEVLRLRGTVLLFGLAHDEPIFPFDWTLLERRLPNIIVTNGSQSGELAAAVDITVHLVAEGRLRVDHLVSHRLSWHQVGRAFDLYSQKTDDALKVIMNMCCVTRCECRPRS